MLSYQHIYHAGNFADVHKHAVLCLVLRRFTESFPGPAAFFDAFAGRGSYDLASPEARKTGESRLGIESLLKTRDFSPEFQPYLEAIRSFNSSGDLLHYPGSPQIIKHFIRKEDRLVFLEMHPTEYAALKKNFVRDRQVQVFNQDTHSSLLNLLPPWEGKGLILLDPSYEIKDEYDRIANLLIKAHKKWPQGIFILWYPLLPAGLHKVTVEKLERLKPLISEMQHSSPEGDRGMYGSGLAMLNIPPDWHKEIEVLSQKF